jgi:hypothetical protein
MVKYMREVSVGLVVAAIIAFGVMYVHHHDDELSKRLSDAMRQELQGITQEVRTERKYRCELAAALFKSGVDVPTSCLVAFSCAARDAHSNRALLGTLSRQLPLLEREGAYVQFMEKIGEAGAKHPAIAPLDADTYLLSSCAMEPSAFSRSAARCVAEFNLKSDAGENKAYELQAMCFRSPIELLGCPDLTTRGLKTIRINKVHLPTDSNQASENRN